MGIRPFLRGVLTAMGRSRPAIARLLLLAFILQIAAPFMVREPVALADSGRVAVCTGEGVHYVYQQGEEPGQPAAPTKPQAKDCAYCLPVFSGHMTAAGESLLVTPHSRLAAIFLPAQSRLTQALPYASSQPRAPPAGALIV